MLKAERGREKAECRKGRRKHPTSNIQSSGRGEAERETAAAGTQNRLTANCANGREILSCLSRVISGRGTTKYTKYTKAGGGKGETLKWGGQNAEKNIQHPVKRQKGESRKQKSKRQTLKGERCGRRQSAEKHPTSNIEHPTSNAEP